MQQESFHVHSVGRKCHGLTLASISHIYFRNEGALRWSSLPKAAPYISLLIGQQCPQDEGDLQSCPYQWSDKEVQLPRIMVTHQFSDHKVSSC